MNFITLRSLFTILMVTALLTLPVNNLIISVGFYPKCALAQEIWKQELMDLCSKTDEAMTFSVDELKRLLEKGDKIRPLIESLEETPRKVYLNRLQKCMNLYSFILESKTTAEKK